MKEIHQDIYQVFYGHIALYDTEDVKSYPVFKFEEKEDIIFRNKGIAITTNSDENIGIIIYKSKTFPKDPYLISGEIEVGKQGLTIGNEAIGDKQSQIPCNSGKVTICVSTDVSPENILVITFVIIEKNKLS